MGVYGKFASFYARGPWPGYSLRIAKALPVIFERFGISPRRVLDLACGEGSFAVLMAKAGFEVTGVDVSPQMLRLARKQAKKQKVNVDFILEDMRSLSFTEGFDLVTCWFDSLNYLLKLEDLKKTFACVRLALKKDGFFIFDMNTIYGLMAYERFGVSWQQSHVSVVVDTPELFVVNRCGYDFKKAMSTWKLTGFMKKEKGWRRMDEVHEERGYALEDIRYSFARVGFEELACFGDLAEMSEPRVESKRLFFVLKKGKKKGRSLPRV